MKSKTEQGEKSYRTAEGMVDLEDWLRAVKELIK